MRPLLDDLTTLISDEVVPFLEGRLQIRVVLLLLIKVAARQTVWTVGSCAGISTLYIPYISVLLLAENDISSLLLADLAFTLHSTFTSTPGKK